MEKNKKKTVLHAVICIGLLCVIWSGYFILRNSYDRRTTVKDDNFSWVYQVESLEQTEDDLILEGFAFQLEKNMNGSEFEILLQELKTEKTMFMEMQYDRREDVNDYFSCGYDYGNSGFSAKISLNKANIQKNDYEILLRAKDEKVAYRTGIYISDGDMMYAEPTSYIPLDVEGTSIKNVVDEGVLRVYRPDYGVYVYQYNGYFYWIMEPQYEFETVRDEYIELQFTTSQIEKLPEERLRNQWYYDNVRFKFLDKEIIDEELGEYRVAKEKIPTEYAITKAWTGKADEEWIWMQEFRPYYYFD